MVATRNRIVMSVPREVLGSGTAARPTLLTWCAVRRAGVLLLLAFVGLTAVWAGLGLTGAAMVVAAFGHIPPTAGALLQEVIDVAVILNALRASGPSRTTPTASGVATAENLLGGKALQSELQPDPRVQISDISFTGHSGR